MSDNRQTRITWEGMSFLAILSFIVLGSILRQINLLVLLSGLMIAPFFFNWRISRKILQRTQFTRRLPTWTHAGRECLVEWELENQRRSIPCWEVRVTDTVRRLDSDEPPRQVQVLFHQVAPGQRGRARYRCLFPQRGICEFGPARASSAFPVGLARTRKVVGDTARLIVAPPIGKFSAKWRRLSSTVRDNTASADIRRRGSSSDEFFSLRNWQQGDTRRMIHWRSSAKRGELLVRQGVDPGTARLRIVIDLSQSGESELFETLVSMATTIVCQATSSEGKGSVCLAITGCPLTAHRAVALGPAATPPLLEFLATAIPLETSGVLEMIAPNRGVIPERVIVLSNRSRESALASEPPGDNASSLASAVHWIDISADLSWFSVERSPVSASLQAERLA